MPNHNKQNECQIKIPFIFSALNTTPLIKINCVNYFDTFSPPQPRAVCFTWQILKVHLFRDLFAFIMQSIELLNTKLRLHATG